MTTQLRARRAHVVRRQANVSLTPRESPNSKLDVRACCTQASPPAGTPPETLLSLLLRAQPQLLSCARLAIMINHRRRNPPGSTGSCAAWWGAAAQWWKKAASSTMYKLAPWILLPHLNVAQGCAANRVCHKRQEVPGQVRPHIQPHCAEPFCRQQRPSRAEAERSTVPLHRPNHCRN